MDTYQFEVITKKLDDITALLYGISKSLEPKEAKQRTVRGKEEE